MEQKCPHCGSKYVQKGRTDENFSEKIHNYRCLSCQKTFSITESKRSAQGTWLMTLYDGDPDRISIERVEIYRNDSGKIVINQKGWGNKYVSGSVKIRIYPTSIHVSIDTMQSANDPNGTAFYVKVVKMNDALTTRALQNEAMRIAYCERSKDFRLEDLTFELSTDIAAYLRFITGASDQDPVSKAFENGCYVATAVYGSYDCPQVWTLRRFRDTTLTSTWYGRAFIRTYYAISPTLVKWFGHTAWFKDMWRGKLDKLVDTLQKQGVESTPYQDKNW